MIDTTREHIGKQMTEELLHSGKNPAGFELIDTAGMNISHCIGCNYCWLKTPGICAIKDDYTPILKKMNQAYLERWCQRTALNRSRSQNHIR